ncbi:hypothetical protein BBK36DRAFT_1106526, partial [Trichoderma citrinoviride]
SRAQSSSSSAVAPATQTTIRQDQLPLLHHKLCVPAESVAQVFFFRRYALARGGAETLYAAAAAGQANNGYSSSTSPVKMQGMLAVGMAGLAVSEGGDGRLLKLARRRYGITLRGVGEVIERGDGERVRGEGTVAAVVLMGMFEAMGCLIKQVPVPAHIRELARSCPAFASDVHVVPARLLFDIICRFAELYSLGGTGQEEEVAQWTERVSAAVGIEEELCSWETGLPGLWRHTVTLVQEGSEKDGSSPRRDTTAIRHEYACSWQAYVWNHYRTCRILVHAVLLRYLDALALPVASAHPALMAAYISQRDASRTVLSKTMGDLRAGMSYVLGLYDAGKGNACLSPETSGVFGLLGAVQALTGVVDVYGEDGEWLCGLLDGMGRRWGIGLAVVLGR